MTTCRVSSVVGVAVGAAPDSLPENRPSEAVQGGRDRRENSGVVLASQQLSHRAGVLHALDGVGLRDVEDGQHRVSDDGACRVFAGVIVGLGDGFR
jgi:hypothetical protein